MYDRLITHECADVLKTRTTANRVRTPRVQMQVQEVTAASCLLEPLAGRTVNECYDIKMGHLGYWDVSLVHLAQDLVRATSNLRIPIDFLQKAIDEEPYLQANVQAFYRPLRCAGRMLLTVW